MADVAELPRRFGRYALFDFIGRGGMAEIFLARAETELGASRLCVIKEILPQLACDADFSELLIAEAKTAARLSHANIVQVFDLGRTEERLYIAMEYVEGYDLHGLLRACSKAEIALPLEHALHVVTQTLKALDYAHRLRMDPNDSEDPLSTDKPGGMPDTQRLLQRLVHRDVSPSNILISLGGEVKLCDFGIARANDALASLGLGIDEVIKGKAGYMSPEQAQGAPMDARADIFAAGIVLWELLAGRRMYRIKDGLSLLQQARSCNVPALPDKPIAGFARLREIASRALIADRDLRYLTASSMLSDLEDWFAENRVQPNALNFGEWLVASFGRETFDLRRSRERVLTPSGKLQALPSVQVRSIAAEAPVTPGKAQAATDVALEPSAGRAKHPSSGALSAVLQPVEVPQPRRAQEVRSVTPSPGAMRAFRDLAKRSPQVPVVAAVEIIGVPRQSSLPGERDERLRLQRAWRWILFGMVVLAISVYVALFR